MLQRYTDFQRVSLSVTKKLKSALVYPALLITLVISLFVFLISFVVPRFAQLYDQLNAPLPAITLLLLKVGNASQSYGLYVVPAVALAGYLAYRWSKTDAGASTVDKLRLGIPLLGVYLAEISGRAVLANAFDAVDRWPAAGAFA